jgi:hypothetical protein
MAMPARKSEITSFPMRPQISLVWEFITPAIAAEYLAKNAKRNRQIRRNWMAILSATMKAGEFLPTHQGIAFSDDDMLIDGQHRLHAIIDSAVDGCWLLVARNVPREAIVAMDLHAKRQPHDQIRIIDEINPDTRDVAIARMVKSGGRSGARDALSKPEISLITTSQIHQFLVKHWDAIRFSQSYAGSKRLGAAPIRAAIARAYYHVDRNKLQRFMEVFGTLMADNPREHAAVNFRKWVDDEKNAHVIQGARGSRAELYMITISAIQAFLKGQHGRSFKAAESDPWPLPEEV